MADAKALTVHVRLLGFLGRFAPGKEVWLTQPGGSTVVDVLASVAQDDASLRSALLDGSGQLKAGLQVAVDGRLIALKMVPTCPVADGSTVMVLPMVGGGGTGSRPA